MNSLNLQPIVADARHKSPLVIEALTKLARKLGPGAKLPTSRELTKALGITGVTLMRCIEQLEGRGILRCRQGSGIYVEAGVQQKWVGMVFGENIVSAVGSEFGALMLRHCALRAAQHRERFSFFLDLPAFTGVMNGTTVPIHQDLVDALKDGKLDGLILVARSSVEQETWLRAQGIPVVRLGSRLGSLTAQEPAVHFNYDRLIQIAVSKMKRDGCTRVGLVAALREHQDMFLAAASNAGLPTDIDWIATPSLEEDAFPTREHARLGREYLERLLSQSKDRLPDGLIFTDDMMTRSALELLSSRGIRLGTDIKIVSHANKGTVTLAPWANSIAQVEFDAEKLARESFDMLESLMKGESVLSPQIIDPEATDPTLVP